MTPVFKYILLALIAYSIYHFYPCLLSCCHKKSHDFESFKRDGWFGLKKLAANEKIPLDPVEIQPFQLNISHTVLEDLRERLRRSNFIDHLPDTKFLYGFNSEYLKTIQQYWLDKYNWRVFEQQLNAFPQFTTKIEGLDIHFIHVKPKKSASIKTIVPILMIHGWPSSFWEYTKIIPLLEKPDSNGLAFEMIIPSIPGYGYSEAPHQPGFNITSSARIFVKLMKRLGHQKFISMGGDWGAAITRAISLIYPENTRAIHSIGNFFMPSKACDYVRMVMAYYFPKWYFGSDDYQKQWDKLFPFGDHWKFLLQETGYLHIQATKPDTIGSVLVDSPIGMAAYILEKFSTWTTKNNRVEDDGGLRKRFTIDELLTNVMIYWTSKNIASSQRFYYENIQYYDTIKLLMSVKSKPFAATIDSLNDVVTVPRKLIESYYENLLQYTEVDGGHFLAFENAPAVANDVRSFVGKVLEMEKQKSPDVDKNFNAKHDEM